MTSATRRAGLMIRAWNSRAGLMEVMAAGRGLIGKVALVNANPAIVKLIGILGIDSDAIQLAS